MSRLTKIVCARALALYENLTDIHGAKTECVASIY